MDTTIILEVNEHCPECKEKLLDPIGNGPYECLPVCPKCWKYFRNGKFHTRPYSEKEENKMTFCQITLKMGWKETPLVRYNPHIDDKMH